MAKHSTEENLAPLWLKELEGKLNSVAVSHQLGHEFGAGSACLNCLKCPGLDLHYWRKQCTICKCRKGDHDIPPDDNTLRFEILHINPDSKRFKTCSGDLDMKIRQKNAALKGMLCLDKSAPLSKVKFDWIPPDTPRELASAYMSSLPSNKLPITGSYGAQYRQKQLQKQIPLYDIAPVTCPEMSEDEKLSFQQYLENVRSNVGVGKIQLVYQKSYLQENFPQYLQEPSITTKLGKIGERKEAVHKSFDTSSVEDIRSGIEQLQLNNINNMSIKPFEENSPNLSETANAESLSDSTPNSTAFTFRPPSAFVPVAKNKFASNSDLLWPKSSNEPSSDSICSSQGTAQSSNFDQSETSDTPKCDSQSITKELKTQDSGTHTDNHENIPLSSVNMPLGPDNSNCKTADAVNSSSLQKLDLDAQNANNNNVLAVEHTVECWNCKNAIKLGSVAVVVGTQKVWHPQCFVCCVCKDLLVDLIYFSHQNDVYCGRHYAEKKEIMRCFACDELIFVKEYTLAEGKAYHVNHFCCTQCDSPLAGKKYILLKDQPNCLDCYDTKLSKKCLQCQLPIRAEQQGVQLNGLNWHATPDCFKCMGCGISLINSKFVLIGNKPFCKKQCVPCKNTQRTRDL